MVGKASKKGWRNIKLQPELTNLHNNEVSAELAQKVDTLFTDDPVGKGQGVSKKIEKIVQLQNKKGKTSASPSEAILLNKAISKVGKPQNHSNQNTRRQLVDPWADAEPVKGIKIVPSTILRRESVAPAVVPACSALSVNPKKEEFEAMLIEEAEKELESSKKKTIPSATPEKPEISAEQQTVTVVLPEVSLKERKTKAQRMKEQRHKQMLKEHELKKKAKEARKALMNKEALKVLEKQQAERREQRMTTQVRRLIDEATGKDTLARGAGGRRVSEKHQVPLGIAPSLRRIVPVGNAVLERRSSLLRRRVIEQVPEINAEYKAKIRFAKFNANKAHKVADNETRARCVLLG